ncbi:putative LPS assembly protein LptD [Tannerella forsythia]|uniref:putative LPS assembly protein LptD n=1 Tax=Tannerella forsythia TaxID=28112 RepID=UPI0028F0E5BB|nr:putative LPS assembly protein LptD [Tannerella forsythia]
MIGWIACVCALWTNGRVQAQESVTAVGSLNDSIAVRQPDSLLQIAADSTLRLDTAAVDTTARKKSMLEAPVTYQASDSIVLTGTNMAYLYGESNVKYQNIELQAERIEMSMDSSIVYATFALDSVGSEYGYPLFVEGEQQIEAKSMRYNFRSRKAYANEVLTQQGEGFLTAGVTKKMPDDAMNLINGRYTTCDEHDHPHFYIKMTKAKVRPGKDIVTGPAYLVIEDVPLFPIGLPFGFFPFSSTYSSGIIMPTYGDEMARGFNLRNGGYYFAISDYIDLALTGEIYTKGSWGLAARSSYRKRYKYSGSVDASYLVTKTGDKGLPDYSVSKDFRIAWTHSQDMKANPYRTFSASVNFSTSSYSRNQLNMLYTPNATDNNKGSSVSISQRFPNSPINISATMNINQRSQDSSLSVTLPDMSISMSSIYPLKRKHIVGKERWYEKISISYSGYFRNTIHTKENEFLRKNLIKDWKHGMQHAIPISATYNFGFLNISPSVNYTERWLTDKVYHKYDTARNALMPVDTVYGFYRVYNYNAAISASTTLYGFFKPWAIFGDKVKMIRHRMEPSVSFSMSPDFGSRKYGYYEDYSYVNRQGETVTGVYSPFKDAMFGPPGRGKQGSINFAVENNVEMKIRSDADSTGERKISLIEKLGFNISYNLAADSFKWSDLNVGLNLRLSKSYSLILNGIFDVYTYGYDTKTQRAYPVNKTRWQAGKGFPRLRSTSTSFSYTFNNDTFKKWFGGRGSRKDEDSSSNNTENEDPDGKPDETGLTKGGRLRKAKKTNAGEYDEDGYYNATVPWNLSFHYNMGLGYGNFNPEKMEYNYRLTHNLSFSGSIQPTKNWRISMNGSFDVEHGKFHSFTCSISRDLHCFQMSANVIPIGPYKSYSFSIAVNSSLLKDLKYNQSNTNRDQQSWY